MKRKCVVWDLDDTMWDGVCLEGEVCPRPAVRDVLSTLDSRGIVHAIASRGDEELARATLRRHGLDQMFVAHRINWHAKPSNISAIADELGLDVGSFVFVDDDPFEREQVAWMLPSVLTVDAREAGTLAAMPELSPETFTSEGRRRRELYLADRVRQQAAAAYPSRRAFLHGCGMKLEVRAMTPADVPRVLELMSRTHQLNTMGISFSRDELVSATGNIRVASLSDRFGEYGTVGVAVVETEPGWTLKYLALSCRVMGRGVERGLLCSVLSSARAQGIRHADALLRYTERNRPMRLLYQMSGLRPVEHRCDGTHVFRIALDQVPSAPPWLELS